MHEEKGKMISWDFKIDIILEVFQPIPIFPSFLSSHFPIFTTSSSIWFWRLSTCPLSSPTMYSVVSQSLWKSLSPRDFFFGGPVLFGHGCDDCPTRLLNFLPFLVIHDNEVLNNEGGPFLAHIRELVLLDIPIAVTEQSDERIQADDRHVDLHEYEHGPAQDVVFPVARIVKQGRIKVTQDAHAKDVCHTPAE